MSSPNTLLLLPLLQGLSRAELLQIAGRVRFDFQQRDAGECLAAQDDRARSLVIVMTGRARIERRADDGSFLLTEWMRAPFVVQPEALFGWRTHYSRSYFADTRLQTLTIEKEALVNELLNYPAFRLNFLNTLCYTAQRTDQKLWRSPSHTPLQRLAAFLTAHALHPAGTKRLRIRQVDLAPHLHISTHLLTRLLQQLADEGLLQTTRHYLTFPSLEALTSRATSET